METESAAKGMREMDASPLVAHRRSIIRPRQIRVVVGISRSITLRGQTLSLANIELVGGDRL